MNQDGANNALNSVVTEKGGNANGDSLGPLPSVPRRRSASKIIDDKHLADLSILRTPMDYGLVYTYMLDPKTEILLMCIHTDSQSCSPAHICTFICTHH